MRPLSLVHLAYNSMNQRDVFFLFPGGKGGGIQTHQCTQGGPMRMHVRLCASPVGCVT